MLTKTGAQNLIAHSPESLHVVVPFDNNKADKFKLAWRLTWRLGLS